ncbi:MAG: RHS repeat-associated core domain-containing protein [Acutalibacteraceae bacterium]
MAGAYLSALQKGDLNVSYSYNSDDLRVSKTVNGVKTEYVWDGSSLIGQKTGNNVLVYLYAADGLAGFQYNGVNYYYLKNGQGDVVGILNASGNIVAKYAYDAWGNLLSVTDATGADKSADSAFIGNINPIRYRSYYYDTETGLYYLQSRYYDPEVGRFINADGVSFFMYDLVNLNQYNMFAYCFNNPVIYYDPTGDFAITISLLVIAGEAMLYTAGVGIGVIGGVLIGNALAENLTNVELAKPSKKTGKETASDKPSWVNKGMVDPHLSAEENARRMLNNKYGPGNWKKGAGEEFNQIKKWLTRSLNLKSLAPDDINDNNITLDENGNMYISNGADRGFGWINGVYYNFLD